MSKYQTCNYCGRTKSIFELRWVTPFYLCIRHHECEEYVKLMNYFYELQEELAK